MPLDSILAMTESVPTYAGPMRQPTRDAVDSWWRDVFGVGDELWSSVTVLHPHGSLGDYEGWYVAWRGAGVHVSAPSTAAAEEVASLAASAGPELMTPDFWHAFARQRGLALIGPSTHAYLDVDPGPAPSVREVAPAELRALGEQVDVADWWECGFDESLDEPGVVAFATDGGGAVLRELTGAPRNVTLLVVPGARRRGVGTELGRAAASYAVRRHGYARWRAATSNIASARTAQRLGFEPYATQLAVRRASA